MTPLQTAASSRAEETPEDIVRKFAQYVHERNLEKLVALYEPDGIFSPEPNVVVKGHDGLRAAFQGFLSLRPVFELVPAQIHQSAELALVENDWNLSGTAPDGTPVRKSGRSSVVLRRGANGNWLIAIDRP